ncbi:hypothetical protein BX661DRAFT_204985 [Kickxella alabastrina]|uniref:uncharacterized protein n=1 Tax=Kickxella alabastrina TaxID=61397 RepID=UPI00221F1E6F|nr:uncharacterized protein BX661DRAFT_204985 [Kickxella alabastrina]KAI7829160.1 hypothetical protein BX661DRAFT_204985 [Kickxella alabastrina]
MKVFNKPTNIGMLLAISAAALFSMSIPAQAELVTHQEYTTMTIVTPILVVQDEEEYHWWDVMTGRAHGLFKPKADHANDLLSRGQNNVMDAGEYVTSNVAEYGQQAKNGVEYLGQQAKEGANNLGYKAKEGVNNLGQKAKEEAGYIGEQAKEGVNNLGQRAKNNANQIVDKAKNKADDLKQRVQDGADSLGQRVAENAKYVGQEATDAADSAKRWGQENVRGAAKRVKHAEEDVYDRLNVDSRRATRSTKHAARKLDRKSTGLFHSVQNYIVNKLQNFASFTRGPSSQLRSEINAGVDRLRDLIDGSSNSATPTWPEKVLSGNRDPECNDYMQELNDASQHAHSLVKSKLNLHSEILESIARSHVTTQLPIAARCGPAVALVLLYLVFGIWARKGELRRRMQQTAAATNSGAEMTRAFQQEYALISDGITLSSTYLTILPMATSLLVIMEINELASWVITLGYTLVIAGSIAGTQPSALSSVFQSTDTVIEVGHQVTFAITAFIAVCCAVNGFMY